GVGGGGGRGGTEGGLGHGLPARARRGRRGATAGVRHDDGFAVGVGGPGRLVAGGLAPPAAGVLRAVREVKGDLASPLPRGERGEESVPPPPRLACRPRAWKRAGRPGGGTAPSGQGRGRGEPLT